MGYRITTSVVVAGILVSFPAISTNGREVSSSDAKDGHKSQIEKILTVSTYDPDRDAASDLAETVNRARAENRRIILEIGGDW